MSTEKKKYTYNDRKIQGYFPGKIVDAKLIERFGRKQVELMLVIDRNGEKEQVPYYGDLEGEYAANAVDSAIAAGFIGDGWNAIKNGVNKDTFQVIPFNVALTETDVMDGDKVVGVQVKARFITSPDASSGGKPLEGTVNGMEGSFAAARQKLQKPTAAAPSKPSWD